MISSNRIASIRAFMQQRDNIRLIVLSLVTTLGGSTIYALMRLILVDSHFALDQVGLITGIGGSLITILGSIIAGPMLIKKGLKFAFYSGLWCVMISGICWFIMVLSQEYIITVLVWPVVVMGCFGIGVTSVCTYTLLMRRAQMGHQSATDFTVFQSIQTLGMVVVPMLATQLSALLGYWSGILSAIIIVLSGFIFVWRYLSHYCDFLTADKIAGH